MCTRGAFQENFIRNSVPGAAFGPQSESLRSDWGSPARSPVMTWELCGCEDPRPLPPTPDPRTSIVPAAWSPGGLGTSASLRHAHPE